MDDRTAFLVQILEKLGAPLMAAVGEVSCRRPENGDEESSPQEAERVAVLLSKSVQVGVSLSDSLDLKDADDSSRLALTVLAGSLVAGQYKLTGQVPGDQDIKRLVVALEAVLSFADNFVPAADAVAQLKNLEAGDVFFDESQANLQYVGALIPVVNVVAAFSFGQPENKLLQDVAGRLVARAESVRLSLLGDGGSDEGLKRAALQILKGLVVLYVQCHKIEMERLTTLDEKEKTETQEGSVSSIDRVWGLFEVRAAMLEVLGKSTIQGDVGVVESVSESQLESPSELKPVEGAVLSEPVSPPQEEGPPTPEQSSVPDEIPQSANPMSFFKPGAKNQGDSTEEKEEAG